jgi:poly(glycerol-phosphate) alpha-glucosyltransferase
MLEAWALRRSSWKKRLAALLYENRTIHGARTLHALCEAEISSIRSFGYRGPVCVIPNGVTLPATMSLPRTCADSEALQLLFLGRIDQKKGLHLLLPAMARALSKHPEMARRWQLHIAGFGDASYETSLRDLTNSLGMSERVRFLGPVFGAAKEEVLTRADAFALPSYSEGLPMAILEAAAHALPILCTAECNLPEVFIAGAGCKLSLDIDEMANELAAFFRLDARQRQDIGQAARGLVETRYQWDSVAAQFESLYAWIVDAGPRPSCVVLD